jgi:hypothetical protein
LIAINFDGSKRLSPLGETKEPAAVPPMEVQSQNAEKEVQ